MASSGSSRQRRVESCKFVVVVVVSESLFFDFSLPSPGDNVLLPISSVSVSCLRLFDVVFVFVFPSLSSVLVSCLPFLISLKLLDMRLSGTRERGSVQGTLWYVLPFWLECGY